MRTDLDSILKQRGLAGVVVLAHDRYCPAFYYATGQKIHHGLYVRSADGRAHLVHDPMERDQAAAVGCATSSYAQRGLLQKVKSAESQARGLAELVVEVAQELGIQGTIAFAGDVPLGFGWTLVDHVRALTPAITVDATQPGPLDVASMTKGEDELDKIRHCSRAAVEAMHRVREMLGSLRADGDGVGRLPDGVPVYGISSDMENVVPTPLGGDLHRFVLEFPELPLLPGTYVAKSHALDETGTRLYDTVEVTHLERTIGDAEVTSPAREVTVTDAGGTTAVTDAGDALPNRRAGHVVAEVCPAGTLNPLGDLEHARSGTSGRRLYRGQPLAQPRRILLGARGDRAVPHAQVGEGTRLPADQGAMGVSRQPHRRALRLRVA